MHMYEKGIVNPHSLSLSSDSEYGSNPINVSNDNNTHCAIALCKIPSDAQTKLIGRNSPILVEQSALAPTDKKRASSATVYSQGDKTMATAATTTSYSVDGISRSSSLCSQDDDGHFIDSIEIGNSSTPTYDVVNNSSRPLRTSSDVVSPNQIVKTVLRTSRYGQYRSAGSSFQSLRSLTEDDNQSTSMGIPVVMEMTKIPTNTEIMTIQPRSRGRNELGGDFLLLPEEGPMMMDNDDSVSSNNFSFMNMLGGRKMSYNPKDENQRFMYVSTIFMASFEKNRRGRGGIDGDGIGVGLDDQFFLEDDENNSTSNHTGRSSLFDESFASFTSVNLHPRTYPHQRYWNGNGNQQSKLIKNQDTFPPLVIPNEVSATSYLGERRTSIGSVSSRSRRRSRNSAALSFISERINLDEVDSLDVIDDDENDQQQSSNLHESLSIHVDSGMYNYETKEDEGASHDSEYYLFSSSAVYGEINLLTGSYKASDPDLTPRLTNESTTKAKSIDDPSLACPSLISNTLVEPDKNQRYLEENSDEYKQQSDDHCDDQVPFTSLQASTDPVSDSNNDVAALCNLDTQNNAEILDQSDSSDRNEATDCKSFQSDVSMPSLIEASSGAQLTDDDATCALPESTSEVLQSGSENIGPESIVEPLQAADATPAQPNEESVDPCLRSDMMRLSFWKSQQEEGSTTSLGSVPMFDHPDRLPNFMMNGMASIDCSDSFLNSSRQSVMSDFSRRSLSDNFSLNLDSSRHSLQSDPSLRYGIEAINESSATGLTLDPSTRRLNSYESLRSVGGSLSSSRMGITHRYSQRFGIVEPIVEDPLEESRLSFAQFDSFAKIVDRHSDELDTVLDDHGSSSLSLLAKEEVVILPEEHLNNSSVPEEGIRFLFESAHFHESAEQNLLDEKSGHSLRFVSRTYPFSRYWNESEQTHEHTTNNGSVLSSDSIGLPEANSTSASDALLEKPINANLAIGEVDMIPLVSDPIVESMQNRMNEETSSNSRCTSSCTSRSSQQLETSVINAQYIQGGKTQVRRGSMNDIPSSLHEDNFVLVKNLHVRRGGMNDNSSYLYEDPPNLGLSFGQENEENPPSMFESALFIVSDDDGSVVSKQSLNFFLRSYPFAKFWDNTLQSSRTLQSLANAVVSDESTNLESDETIIPDRKERIIGDIVLAHPVLSDAHENEDSNTNGEKSVGIYDSQLVIDAYHEFFIDTLRKKLDSAAFNSEKRVSTKVVENVDSETKNKNHGSNINEKDNHGAVEYGGFFDELPSPPNPPSTPHITEEQSDDLSDMTESVTVSVTDPSDGLIPHLQEDAELKKPSRSRPIIKETGRVPPALLGEQPWSENISYSNPATIASSLGIKDGLSSFFSSLSRHNGLMKVKEVGYGSRYKGVSVGANGSPSSPGRPIRRRKHSRRNSTGSVSSTSDPTGSQSTIDPHFQLTSTLGCLRTTTSAESKKNPTYGEYKPPSRRQANPYVPPKPLYETFIDV